MMSWGRVALGTVLPFMFTTYDGATGASEEGSGLAVTDIEIYKAGGGLTQRSSDAGYALLDADGHALDSIVGLAGFSVDTGDNTDAGFFVAGGYYIVVVASVTVDAQTVNFIAGTFSLGPTLSVAGVEEVDVTHWLGTAAATPTVAGVPEVDLTHVAGSTTSVSALASGVATLLADWINGGRLDLIIDAILADTNAILVDTGTTLDGRIPAALVGGRMDASVGAMAAAVVTAAAIATDAIGAAELAADAVTEIRSLASGTSDSGTTTTMVDAVRTEADTDYWKGALIVFTSGVIAGQSRLITAFTPATDTITFAPAVTQAVATQTYEIWPAGRTDLHMINGVAQTATLDDIEAQTDDIGAAGAGLTAVPWNAAWDAEVESEVDDALGGGTGTALTAIPWNASWDAEVQSEVADALEVALSDSVPADGSIPSAKQALYMIVQFLYERSVSSTTVTIRKADGSTSLLTCTLNDATTPTSITRAT